MVGSPVYGSLFATEIRLPIPNMMSTHVQGSSVGASAVLFLRLAALLGGPQVLRWRVVVEVS